MKHSISAPTTFALVATCLSLLIGASLLSPTTGATPAAGDPIQGKTLFEKRCGGCHSLDQAKEGPPLRTVFGRHAGSVPDFKYSDALKGAGFTWDEANLDKWLTDTESVVPDNDMNFHVPKPDERADIIQYLRATSGK